ncbi:hypothetical protein [Tautonia rosea]|uniref:hypothetical protein n=1 Tax=Tautonia rosea TaxID=2728037 RepID=UPI0014750667|nr:hypothetical protein [Tautonia rosea]
MRIRYVEGRLILSIPRRPKLGLRGLILLVAVSALVLSYPVSYHRLSRRGLQEAEIYGIEGFLYVPFEEAAASEDLSRHYALKAIYTPANWIDRTIFGGPYPTLCIIWRLSG